MTDLRVRTIDEADLDTVLAGDIEFEGTIESAEPLLVKGHVTGDLRSDSDVYVADTAKVEADIDALRVSVKGAVAGDVVAKERVELFSGASISGNLRTPDLIVQSGSYLNGRCEMPEQVAASAEAAE